jgi:hypothetical protein
LVRRAELMRRARGVPLLRRPTTPPRGSVVRGITAKMVRGEVMGLGGTVVE